MKENKMQEMVNYCKQYGFVFQGSEIYGGLANTFDFGPVGVLLKRNLKEAWIKRFIQEDTNNVSLDSAILMNPKTWEASGHITTFSDPLIDCKCCKMRYRADKLVEDNGCSDVGCMDDKELVNYIKEHKITCPICGKSDFSPIRQFNIMFKTFQGVLEDKTSEVYLRPETAQGMFVNFKNIVRSMRKRVPFGIGQIGKSFRNEITPGNFIFRTREFEQMELEFFCKPDTDLEWFEYWKDFIHKFLLSLGLRDENLRLRNHSKEELCFYSKATTDFEYEFPFGWGELWGLADRTDYDLKQHMQYSGVNLEYTDPITNEKYVPYCIEPAVGLTRLTLAVLMDAYSEQVLEDGQTRIVLKLNKALAPYKVAILPLIKKNHSQKAEEIFNNLIKTFSATYDETGSIGKRYRRQDEIGTPYCVTIDDETINNNTVTIRDRDSMQQQVINVDELVDYLQKEIKLF